MCLGAARGHRSHPCLEQAASSREGSKAWKCSLGEDPHTLLSLQSQFDFYFCHPSSRWNPTNCLYFLKNKVLTNTKHLPADHTLCFQIANVMSREAASVVEHCAPYCASHNLGAHFMFLMRLRAPSSSATSFWEGSGVQSLGLPACLLVLLNLVIDACIFHLLPLLLQR